MMPSFMFQTFSLGNKVSISSTIIARVARGILLSEVQLPWKERLRKGKAQTLFTKCFVGFLSYSLPGIPIQEVKLDDLFINKNYVPRKTYTVLIYLWNQKRMVRVNNFWLLCAICVKSNWIYLGVKKWSLGWHHYHLNEIQEDHVYIISGGILYCWNYFFVSLVYPVSCLNYFFRLNNSEFYAFFFLKNSIPSYFQIIV